MTWGAMPRARETAPATPGPGGPPRAETPALLRVEAVSKRFGGLWALREVGFDVRAGEIVGVVGPNGAGKSTLFNVVAGVCAADGGRITFRGEEIGGLPPHAVCRRGLARTFQIVQPFVGMTVAENILVGLLYGRGLSLRQARPLVDEVLVAAGLVRVRDQPSETITVADRRRLELARALATRPELILLDENMAGLTPSEMAAALDLLRAIRSRGVTIVLVEHVMQAVTEICDRIVVLNHGQKIAEGRAAEIVTDPQVIEAYLGTPHVL